MTLFCRVRIPLNLRFDGSDPGYTSAPDSRIQVHVTSHLMYHQCVGLMGPAFHVLYQCIGGHPKFGTQIWSPKHCFSSSFITQYFPFSASSVSFFARSALLLYFNVCVNFGIRDADATLKINNEFHCFDSGLF